MCLAIPGKLIEIASDSNGVRMGKANFGGIVKQVCLEYTPEVQTGDYVLVHVGFALSKVDENEAARTYQLLEEMKQLGELDTPEVSDNGFSEEHEPSPQSSPWPGRGGREAPGEGRYSINTAAGPT
jgi:hydrogenase expression/formation protein HypC